jgi:leucyl aminopeptidase
MTDLLPPATNLKVRQTIGPAARATLAKLDQLIVVIPAKPPASSWRRIPDGTRLGRLAGRLGKDKSLNSRLQNERATGVCVHRLPVAATSTSSSQQFDAFKLLKFAGKLVADALRDGPRSAGLMIVGLSDDLTRSVAEAIILAAAAHGFQMPVYRGKAKRTRHLNSLRLLDLSDRIDIKRTLAEADALNLVRWLTSLPPNKLSAAGYRKALQSLAKTHGWKMNYLTVQQLQKLGAGAFMAVAQGNADQAAGIAHLRYTPEGLKKTAGGRLALVGKGIIFDTGGTNLKPFKAMLDMHEDMCGSAVAVATLKALTEIDYPYPVDCWLAITENRTGAKAYKSRDVVTTVDGTTIEVIHTDAEGRMALADTLALAGREKPDLLIDYATLTGTCLNALTDRYSGVFTNRPSLNNLLIDAGVASGERVWPFPMDADYEEDLKSKVADILQCSVGGDGDHILAARFLKRFVPKSSAWIHVDLSAATRKTGLAQVPAGTTGFGVRFTLNLLLDQADRLNALIGKTVGAASNPAEK